MAKKTENLSGFQKFLDENKSLKFMLPLLAILAIVAVVMLLGSGKDKNTVSEITSPEALNQIEKNKPQVEVLPQIIRSENGEKIEVNKDPFIEPMTLVGIIHSKTNSTAIIKWGGVSYIVKTDYFVGESNWKVSTIEKDKITLVSNDDSIVLALDGSIN